MQIRDDTEPPPAIGPRRLRQPPTLVGRERELRELRAALERILRGEGAMYLLSGEPGIGKTRLAEEAGREAERRGALVSWGRCWEGGDARPFWPWIQILRAYTRAVDREQLRREMGAEVELISRVAPEIFGGRRVGAQRPISVDTRFAVFDAMAQFWRTVAEARPCVFVLDDLHAADMSSLLLLQFLASQLRDAPVLLLGNHREREVEQLETRAVFADLARRSTGITLSGLSLRESGDLVQAVAGEPASELVVADLHRATGGNPYFLHELARAFGQRPRGHGGELPLRVREVVEQRLAKLSKHSRDVLELAAVIGGEFDLRTLRTALATPATSPAALLAEVLADGLVTRVRGGHSYRFSHALIRETLYESLPERRRTRLHLRVGRALEREDARGAEAHLSALAHHFRRAKSLGAATKAVTYFRRAGERAYELLAFDEAIEHFRRGLECSPVSRAGREHCELLLGLGNAHRACGASAAAHAAFDEAATVARRLKARDLFLRAALEPAPWRTPGAADARRIERLEILLRELPARPRTRRARLLACLGRELFWSDSERALALTQDAVEIGRGTRDPDALAYALDCRCSILEHPGLGDERLAASSEMLRLTDRTGDNAQAAEACRWRLAELMSRGDVAAAEGEIGRQASLARNLRQPDARWRLLLSRAMRELLAGAFGEAERLIGEAAAFQGATAAAAFHGQMFVLMREQGRHEELLPMMEAYAASQAELGGDDAIHSGLAVLHAELGHLSEARLHFERFAHDDFGRLPSFSYQMVLGCLADTAVLLGDVSRAAQLYERLLPFRRRNLVLAPVLACLGPADRMLALLAVTRGRIDLARTHLADALALCDRLGSPPILARTQMAGAVVLGASEDDGERREAARLQCASAATADTFGMAVLERLVQAVPMATPSSLEAVAIGAPQRASCQREGDTWRLLYLGVERSLKHTVGMSYLAELLAHPGRPLHALELATAAAGVSRDERTPAELRGEEGVRTTRGAVQSPHLDGRTRALYRGRLQQLRSELDQADRVADTERATRLREEMALLATEVGRAAGVGMHRAAGTPAERARINVGKALRRALSRVAGVHEPLGSHLDRCVKTGTFCVYQPDPRVPMHWTVQR